MSLLDGGLQAIFGSAFAAVYLDASLVKTTMADTGQGGFAVRTSTTPVKANRESLSAKARAASGLPDVAVTIRLLRAGVPVAVDLDDRLIVSGSTYRIVRVEDDPASAAWTLVGVPAPPP